MLDNQTIDKLYQLKLRGMAQALEGQLGHGDMAGLSFMERLGLLVDREWTVRKDRCLTRRLQIAKLKHPAACVEDINYRHQRGMDKSVVQELTTCRWIAARRNLLVTGATGLGKTWLACAFGNKACRDCFTTTYKRVPRLAEELSIARADGTYLKVLAGLARMDLLILDDWGIAPLDVKAQHSLLEVIDDRAGNGSTLVTSQLPVERWHDTIGDPTVADALLDRLVSAATVVTLKGESMRKLTEK